MSARQRLHELLRQHGNLHGTEQEPIVDEKGARFPWMFYSWNVSMTGEGLQLAGQVLGELLTANFQARQIATKGYTAIPLLSACLLEVEGASGLVIRDQAKAYGARRQVEGPADRSRPVVVIDDSLVSGRSMTRAIEALERNGFQVEGGFALMNFPHRGGLEYLRSMGYKVATAYDIDYCQSEVVPDYLKYTPASYAQERLAEGLHPAVAARRAAEFYLQTGKVIQPPLTLDQKYSAPGGTFVSFRDRETDYRLYRDGYWHFDCGDAVPPRDVVLGSVMAVRRSRMTLDKLRQQKICVTFLGPMEEIQPAQLDFSRYGIVVRSLAFPGKMGGALPNTQVFVNELEQYRHARSTNAKVIPGEPHQLLRHTLEKHVEPGCSWLPYGSEPEPWLASEELGRALLAGRCEFELPAPVFGVAVTFFRKGVAGSGVAFYKGSLAECLGEARQFALADGGQPDMPFMVSLLHDPEAHNGATLDYAVHKLRMGKDALCLRHQGRWLVYNQLAACYCEWDRQRYGRELLQLAGLKDGRHDWVTCSSWSWLSSGQRAEFGYPDRSGQLYDRGRLAPDMQSLTYYLLNHLGKDGLYDLFSGSVVGGADPVALAVSRLALRRMGREVKIGLADPLIQAVSGEGLGELWREDGCFRRLDSRGRLFDDHDRLPGAILLSLALAGRDCLPPLEPTLEFYRRRFLLQRPPELVAWQVPAWAAVYRLAGWEPAREFVLEMGEWMLSRQLEKDGSFVVDSPKEITGMWLQALAEAWHLDGGERYQLACQRALNHLHRLMVRDEDLYCAAQPARAAGGVRVRLNSSRVSLEATAWALVALSKIWTLVTPPARAR